ncbi:MAG TPA: TonB-dependent receptor [Candidatus Sulfopaludibacter sp.]|nr:TonB-dependent receptor [Candidatus Sulfopaludibacter sp.]
MFCVLSIAAACRAAAAEVVLSGEVRDENDAPVAGARIMVSRATPSSAGPWRSESDLTGAFSLTLPAPGDYLVDVERQGYYQLKGRPVHVEGALSVTLAINTVREVFQSVDVNEQPSPVDIAQTQSQERLTGTEVNDMPYPSSHSLRSAMKLIPGVVEDTGGGMHLNGSSENQVQYTLNGFNVTDPISGQYRTTLAVEGVRSVDYSSGRYSPELGKGSAGVVAIRTESGTDKFHYTATDFIPGLDLQQGVALGNWYPRVGVSGPIVRGRAWFSDTVDFEYNTTLITGLPNGQNTRSGMAANNLLHTQINLTPRNILFADFLVNADNEDRVGLSPLDPVSTTRTVDTREYLFGLKDQYYLGGKSLIEFGYAHNGFSNNQTTQGPGQYVYSAAGRTGNYFVTSDQTASRDETMAHYYAPQFRFAGSHQIQAGVDGDYLRYNGDFRRTGYQLLGLSNELLSQTSFQGSGLFGLHDWEAAGWALDTWQIAKRLQIDAGMREDWDRLVRNAGWSPRVAFSWAPFRGGRTRVAGGYAVTRDAVPMDAFGRALDQSAVTTEYAGGVPVGQPVTTVFLQAPGPLSLPRATNWSLDVDHQVSAHVVASVKYLRRRGTDGFNFVNTLEPDAPPSLLPLPNGATAGAYQLSNLRRDDFDSVQLSVHQTFSGQYEWMASYTRSRAQSNAVLDMNTLEPLQVMAPQVPMPWDAPNRVLAWTYLPLPWKNWSVAVLADARSGFPFSVQQVTGEIVGGVNSYRYPINFDLNLAIERMVTFHGYRFALRGGVNNLTNQRNPTAVNNMAGSPQYLQFLGDEGRHFVVRIRFFGRAGTK